MKCPTCGAVTADGPFCSSCGASFAGRFPPGAIKGPPKTSGMAITGFVTSFFCGIVGIIFSLIGWKECRKSSGVIKGEGFAIAGFIISVANIGFLILGFVAMTSFFDYVDKAVRHSEAEYNLKRLERAVKTHHIINAELPIGRAPLTPAKSCCEDPSGCYSADAEFSESAAWRQLDFEVYGSQDFQYSYESDGRTFRAKAVGDSDCDGTEVVYELRIDIVDGNATGTITRPKNRD
jgi:hypothetical protein